METTNLLKNYLEKLYNIKICECKNNLGWYAYKVITDLNLNKTYYKLYNHTIYDTLDILGQDLKNDQEN